MTSEIEDILCRADEAVVHRQYFLAWGDYRKAERLSRKADLPRLQARAAQGQANCACQEKCFARALALIDTAIEAWGRALDPRRQAEALVHRARILEQADRLHDARLAYRKARAAMTEAGQPYDVGHCDGAIERLGDRIASQARADRRAGGPKSARGRFLSPRMRALIASISLWTGRPVRPRDE